jgi:hypothetical protein
MERTEKGTFAKGNTGGPGRPKKEREEKYSEIMLNTVSYERWKRIIEKAASQAEKGDSVARKWLSDYLIGPAVQKIAPVTPDGENPYMSMEASELLDIARKLVDAGNP